jgi:hypothetical protein
MPTPFMHLQVAERILTDDSLQIEIRRLIERNYPAFYLGNVAPDYQTICNVAREKTHFYKLPPDEDNRAYPQMLATYPELDQPATLQPGHAVFIAAYCAHLMLDLRWYHEVLIPFFVAPIEWESHRQRFVVHNTLLTYLDKLAVKSLPHEAAATLSSAQPDGWLPFALDQELMDWRDMLVEQLQPGAQLRTVEIYAERLFLTPEEFSANLEERSWMDEFLFNRVPIDEVQQTMTSAVVESVELLTTYLAPCV